MSLLLVSTCLMRVLFVFLSTIIGISSSINIVVLTYVDLCKFMFSMANIADQFQECLYSALSITSWGTWRYTGKQSDHQLENSVTSFHPAIPCACHMTYDSL